MGLDREGPRERDPLLLAAGQLVRVAPALGEQADELEHLVRSPPPLRAVHPAQPQAVGDVVAGRHVREQAVGLEDHAHVAAVGRHVGDVLAVDDDPAAVRLVEPGQRAQRGRLAAAGRAEQRDQLPRGDLQGETVEGADRSIGTMEVEQLDGDARSGAGRGRGGCGAVVTVRAPPSSGSSAVAPSLRADDGDPEDEHEREQQRGRARPRRRRTQSRLPSRLMTTWSVS